MAARRRRLTPAAAVRLALIVGANAAAVWGLWSLVHRPARAGSPPAPAESAAEAPAPARESGAAGRARAELRLERAGGRIRAIAARAVRKASELSRGKVAAAECRVAVHVRDPGTGAEWGHDADASLRPASNMKLATTAAALTLLGSAWEFATPIEARGELAGGRLAGDLVVRASGDPLFDPDAEGSVRALLAPALDELERAGVQSVGGRLVLDEGTFDAPAPPPGWPGAEQRHQEYCALSGGLSANRGCLTVRVAPGAVGARADVGVEPAGFELERKFSATTSASGALTLGFDARPAGLIVRGTIPASAKPFVGSCPVPDPVLLFGEVLRHELAARGIRIEGATVRERGSPPGAVVARIRRPLCDYLAPIHQESNNAVADQVWLATSNAFQNSGARARAQGATLEALSRLGVPGDGFRQVDGSGLSAQNRASARQLTALLAAVDARDDRTRELYRASLAKAGVSGTLDDRMRNSPAAGKVLGKTGFIAGVSALSGIALAPGGELVFSILVEYPDFGGLNTSVWKPMQDEICAALVEAGP